jgi:hypothetical protein
MLEPLASVTLTHTDLFRLVSPRLLAENPFLAPDRAWVFNIVNVAEGIRVDVVRPAEETEK